MNVKDGAAVGECVDLEADVGSSHSGLLATEAKKHTTGLANVAAPVYFNIANDVPASVHW